MTELRVPYVRTKVCYVKRSRHHKMFIKLTVSPTSLETPCSNCSLQLVTKVSNFIPLKPIVSTSESFPNCTTGICLNDATYRNVHSRNTDEQSTDERRNCQSRLKWLLPPCRHTAILCYSAFAISRTVVGHVVKPEGACYSVGVP